MLFIILIIISIVIYFVTLTAKEDKYNVQNNDEIQLNIDLYDTVYECLKSAHHLVEDPSSLKKYMMFKRNILVSKNFFEELETYNDLYGFNRYLEAGPLSKYNLNKILEDLMTIRKALHQSHDFLEFKDNVGNLSSSFKLLIHNGITLNDIHNEHQEVMNQLKQRMQG